MALDFMPAAARDPWWRQPAPPSRPALEYGCRHSSHISHLPEPILTNIFTLVTDVRSRNCMSLTCRDWYLLERLTRTRCCLRGNIAHLASLPMCFNLVTTLDLSHISPWGYSIFHSTNQGERFARLLIQAFPLVKEVTMYVKDVYDVQMVAILWPNVETVRLVRWHQKPTEPEEAFEPGTELHYLLTACKKLRSLDLSMFYCWKEDVPPALAVGSVAENLRSLNLLKILPEGFRAQDLAAICGSCKNLEEFFIICDFDPRYLDPVGDEAIVSVGKTCPKLRVLHLVDTNEWNDPRGTTQDGFAVEDANITRAGLQEMFASLPNLEELVFLLAQNVRDAGPALETLPVHCKSLKTLKLSHFHGVCKGPQQDGVARCKQLVRLSVKNCADLQDSSLLAIGKGCELLQLFHLKGIATISSDGLANCVERLASTLKDVEVSWCEQLDAAQILRCLKPVRSSLHTLKIDCVWDADIVAREDAAAAATAAVGSSDTLGVADILSMNVEDLFPGPMSMNHFSLQRPAIVGSRCRKDTGLSRTAGYGSDFITVGFAPSTTKSDFATLGFDPGDRGRHSGFNRGKGSDFVRLGFHAEEENVESRRKRPKRCVDGSEPFVVKGLPKDSNSQYEDVSCGKGRIGSVHIGNQNGGGSAGQGKFWHGPSYEDHATKTGLEDNWRHASWNTTVPSHHYDGEKSVVSDGWSSAEDQEELMQTLMRLDESFLGWNGEMPSEFESLELPPQSWSSLRKLSLRIAPLDLIKYLPAMGLQSCPVLEEIHIKAEGDLKPIIKPPNGAWGLGALACYLALSKLDLDLSDAAGYALSAPRGYHDLSQWERFFLTDIRNLCLKQLDYSPPSDKDLSYRGLSLPASGLFSECVTLRKLIVHGTANEHIVSMLKQCNSLRDFQLRSDYYPASPDECTELRVSSCKRFEIALAERGYPD